jgi:hypothetical protein
MGDICGVTSWLIDSRFPSCSERSPRTRFDGAGHWSRTETENANGNPFPPQTVAGTYTVNADCTGTTLDELGHASTFAIVNHGKEMLALVTDHGVVLTIDLKKE